MTSNFTVSTNLSDYAPGATAMITASGFDAGSTIIFNVQHVEGAGIDGLYGTADDDIVSLGGDGHEPWYVVDGDVGDLDGLQNGTVVTSWYVNPDDSLGARFLLTALSGDGGLATETFTDSLPPPTEVLIKGAIIRGNTSIVSAPNIFLTLRADQYQAGYNTSARPVQFDEDSNNGLTRSVPLQSIPRETIGGLEYYVFSLKLDEDPSSPEISLGSLKIFSSTNLYLTSMNLNTDEFPAGTATLLYDLYPARDQNLTLVDWNSDPSAGDYEILIPSVVGLSPTTLIHLYCEFGPRSINGSPSDGGAEQWFLRPKSPPSIAVDKAFVSVTDGNNNGQVDAVGDVLNYKITVTNTGGVLLTGVSVVDPLTGLNQSGVGLFPGQSRTFTTSYTIEQADLDNKGGGDGDIDNTATADSDQTEPVSDSVEVKLASNPSMTIDKQATLADGGTKADAAGDVINYAIIVRNNGDVGLTDVKVTDLMLSASPLLRFSGDTDSDNVLDLTETWTYRASYVVTQADLDDKGGGNGYLDNTAIADSQQTEEVSDTAQVSLVYTPMIEIDKSFISVTGGDDNGLADHAGDVLNYEVVVTNTGNVTLTGVSVVDPMTGQNISNVTLAVGESKTYKTSYTLTQADLDDKGGGNGYLDNTAIADSQQTEEVSDSAQVLLAYNPMMEIDKVFVNVTGGSDDQTNAAGDLINYAITIRNAGNITLTGIRVVDEHTGLSDSISRLAPGESKTYNTSYTLTQADLDNRGGGDRDIDNVATAFSEQAQTVSDSVEVPLVITPSISIDKLTVVGANAGDNLTGIQAGETVLWRYIVTNTGNTTLSNIYVSDDNGSPDNSANDFTLTYQSGYQSGDDGDGVLDVGETWIFEKTTMAIAGRYENTGVAYGMSGDSTVDDSDTSSYTAIPPAGLIAPTGTTVQQYAFGTASTFQAYYASQGGDIQYSVKSGKINQTNPGVFFYYTGGNGGIQDGDADGKVEKITVLIDQTVTSSNNTLTTSFKPLNYANIQLYKVIDSGISGQADGIVNAYDTFQSVQISASNVTVSANGDVTVNFMPDAEGTMYVLSVKYETSAVVGNAVGTRPALWPTINYDFDTWVNGTFSQTDEGGINLAPKAVSKLMLDGTAGDGARAINASQIKAAFGEALAYWSGQGFDVSALKASSVEIANLGKMGDQWLLGITQDGHITIDDDAAGHGWSIGLGGVSPHKVDLLSVLLHEIGHVIGQGDDTMGAWLAVGERMLPTAQADEPVWPLPASALGIIGTANAPIEAHFG